MRINADFSQRAIVQASADQWVRSSESGVNRLMLDRIGDEVARATSMVRYAAGSSFPRHQHAKGEEFLVLQGVFSDESGDYADGTYVRNPPGTGHSPFSTNGCTILVKLRQFDAEDLQPCVIDTRDADKWVTASLIGGESRLLHEFRHEQVSMLRIAAAETVSIDVADGGLEWLLVSGAIGLENTIYTPMAWFRFPAGDSIQIQVVEDCTIWQKTGHLPVLSERTAFE